MFCPGGLYEVWTDIPPYPIQSLPYTLNSTEHKNLNRLAWGEAHCSEGDAVANTSHLWLFNKENARDLSQLGLDCLSGAWAHRLTDLSI